MSVGEEPFLREELAAFPQFVRVLVDSHGDFMLWEELFSSLVAFIVTLYHYDFFFLFESSIIDLITGRWAWPSTGCRRIPL